MGSLHFGIVKIGFTLNGYSQGPSFKMKSICNCKRDVKISFALVGELKHRLGGTNDLLKSMKNIRCMSHDVKIFINFPFPEYL